MLNQAPSKTSQNLTNSDDVIALVSDKWVGHVLRSLRLGNNRYGQLRRTIPGITRKMLTQTLRKLERNGIILRTDYDESPPRVEYSITPLGETLIAHLTTLCQWSKQFYADVEAAREDYDATNDGWI
ncbi:MAG: helix-turn-helix domain-containing protein [Chloroflexota bacterium]